MKVIGLLGEQAGGKGSFVSVLREVVNEPIEVVSSSAMLLEILKILAIEPSRPNFKHLFFGLSSEFGSSVLTEAAKLRIQSLSTKARVVVYDSVRMPADVRMVRSFPSNYLVYVTAYKELRYERSRLRKEKAGEDQLSFKDFLDQEKAENECFVPEIGLSAEFQIKNNDSLEWLQKQIACAWKKINKAS